jgi:glycosyltransferase involved in cell wall biosynthesis
VYCQQRSEDGSTRVAQARWRNIRLVHVFVPGDGAFSSVVFDLHCALRALRDPGTLLTLGYNTAVFGALFRLLGRRNVINMDGLEWQRAKWSRPVRCWLYLNERIACALGDALVADHPAIGAHLAARAAPGRISVIPYGADEVRSAKAGALRAYGIEPDRYVLLVARPEPENSVLEVVRAFSARRQRLRLVVLGHYDPSIPFHRRVLAAASAQVLFPGAVYERRVLDALRLHCRFYVHGHRVGGTNPSLVEALGSGCAVLAHDNRFNRWVAGARAAFFTDEEECQCQIAELSSNDQLVLRMREASRRRFREAFRWEGILRSYEELLRPSSEAARAYDRTPRLPA